MVFHYRNVVRASRPDDEPDLAVLPQLILPDWVCVDMGANIGKYTKHLSCRCKKVVSFEAAPFTFRVLSNVVHKLGFSNVELHHCALSDKDGRGAMRGPNIYEAQLREGNEVEVCQADTILSSCERVDFIKCDVEGHELEAVNGSIETVKRFKPAWLIETNWDSALFSRMEELGYVCYVESAGKVSPRNGARKTNYFFLHHSRLTDYFAAIAA